MHAPSQSVYKPTGRHTQSRRDATKSRLHPVSFFIYPDSSKKLQQVPSQLGGVVKQANCKAAPTTVQCHELKECTPVGTCHGMSADATSLIYMAADAPHLHGFRRHAMACPYCIGTLSNHNNCLRQWHCTTVQPIYIY